MKKITSVTVWNDSTGTRLSVTYSEIDEQTHRIIADNKRENYVLVGEGEINTASAVTALAQSFLDATDSPSI